MPNNFLIVTTTTVFSEHIDLRNRFPGRDRDILDMTKRAIFVEQVSRVQESDASQFFDYALLADVDIASQRAPPLLDVCLDVRQLHQSPDTRVDLAHVRVRVTSLDVRLATILVRVCNQMIAKAPLLACQPVLVSAGS